ncbi:MAG: hypothetical protein LBF54_03655 [Holosporaceae bacterium]|jgi:hypothetical protein|nr:hypothetical protein [Holosporaceae bacterium]
MKAILRDSVKKAREICIDKSADLHFHLDGTCGRSQRSYRRLDRMLPTCGPDFDIMSRKLAHFSGPQLKQFVMVRFGEEKRSPSWTELRGIWIAWMVQNWIDFPAGLVNEEEIRAYIIPFAKVARA